MTVHVDQERLRAALPRPLRFLLAGGTAALVNFATRIVLNRWLPYSLAIVLAYLCGMATAFALNRRFVFRESTNRLHQQMFWFAAVNALALLQTLAISLLFAHFILPWCGIRWHAHEIAHAVGIAVPIFTSYVGHKRWTFR